MLRSLLIAGLFAYLFVLLAVLMAHKHPGYRPVSHRYNVVLFRSISRDIPRGGRGLWLNVVGNVAAFAPVGLLVYVLQGSRSSIRQAVLAAAALSIMVELAQFQSGRRYSDVDDVVLNTLGGAAGYAAALALGTLHRHRRPTVAS